MAEPKNESWVRRFDISSPKKHKNGFIIYKVTSVVFPKLAPEASTCVVVWKRFSDFKKLYDVLKNYHKQYKVEEKFPEECKGKYFTRLDENVISYRMNFALELLNFIGRHQLLFTSEPFLQFFNSSHNVEENTFASDENSQIYFNNDNFDSIADQDLKKNFFSDRLWKSRSNDGSIFNCQNFSDDEGILTMDSPDSVSPIHSFKSIAFANDNFKNDHSNVVDANSNDLEEAHVGETVTCHSEKPVSSAEVFFSVRTEDFGAKVGSLVSLDESDESWVIFPETFPVKQDYLVEAAYHVGQAQKFEVEGEFEAAFCFYKAAIACLLSGIQDDEDRSRRQAVREKINQYLQRAEKIYALYLAPERQVVSNKLTGLVEELKVYKVLEIIDRVMLVLNTSDGKYYVIKVLEKSSCPVDTNKKTTIPFSVPYMVKLIKYFENENSIFLVLEYVSRGKLWNHLNNFSQGLLSRDKLDSYFSNNYRCEFLNALKSHEFKFKEKETETKDNNQSIENLNKTKLPTINIQDAEEILVNSESTAMNYQLPNIDPVALEVTSLLENSQKLLSSVNETLQKSEKLTNNLSKDLIDIETVFDLKCRLLASEKPESGCVNGKKIKKRSRSAAGRSKLERSHSSEEVSESRPRTASSSLDRRSEWSKLEAASPRLPESLVRGWAAELLVALETLHRWGIIYRDLHPGNLLLGEDGQILITFQALWKGVDSPISEESVSGFYAAPENMSVFPITPAADWWSFGALLHHLLTGKALSSCYPEGIFGHTILAFPDYLSPEACSLLKELLRYEPGERLGSGVNGTEEIKCHPFFKIVDWQLIYDNS